MSKLIDGASIFTAVGTGFNNTFSTLSQQFPNGLTLENLASKEANTALSSNSQSGAFKQYLTSNFTQVDKNKDGKISPDEMKNLNNNISSQGLTLEQLYQLGASGGISSSLLETVAAHFNEIDKNKDGKVTNAEIKAYGVESSVETQRKEDRQRLLSNMSLYHGEDVEDTSSLLDYKYIKEDKKES